MSEEISLQEVQTEVFKIFKHAFITNCKLDDDNITEEEQKTLKELDTLEVLENLKDLVIDLLNFKKEMQKNDQVGLVKRCQQFETMLQKLESEIRNHIRIEHQLKIHLESSQGRADELELQNKKLQDTIGQLQSQIQQNATTPKIYSPLLENKVKNLQDLHRVHKIARPQDTDQNSDIEQKLVQAQNLAERRQRVLQKFEHENLKLRASLDEKNNELLSLKQENTILQNRVKSMCITNQVSRNGSDVIIFNKQPIEKQPTRNRRIINKSPVPTRPRTRQENSRKSMNELDFMKLKEQQRQDQIRQNNPRRRLRRPKRGHNRSSSDTSHPLISAKPNLVK